ncbi:MAG TPA: histidine kinase [Nocardioides sp.]|uniref:sensor histidine kinase n=1 Tax=Nocardioides sp. TaxID=35761 RepID=UPI002F428610
MDAAVAACFVLAAVAEAVVVQRGTPGLLVFDAVGAVGLVSLAVRRTHPLVSICVIAVGGVVGTTVTALAWPDAPDSGGVWILAMLLASYSLGAHGSGRPVLLGVLLPLVVVSSADLTTRSGWDRISGMVFVTLFIGALPTAVGRLVRVRRERLAALRDQHRRIVQAQRAQQQSAVLAERLRASERLQPTLVDGLAEIAAAAESGADPGDVEASARALLGRTREEVVALTAPVATPPIEDPLAVDHVQALRAAAQPWTVLAAGAVVVGLSAESASTLPLTAPDWVVLPAALAVGIPFAMTWWRPIVAVTLTWVATAAYARSVAPIDGSLSETALSLTLAFAVAALSPRRTAVVGLLVCWLGQLVGVGTGDLLGEGLMLLVCWLGGVAVNEVSRLVEQARANNELLARQEATAATRAVLDERLRLAREIHDAIGHSLTVVALQAGAARRLADRDPAGAREVMRTVAAAAADGAEALAADGSTDLASLVERVAATGLLLDADLADDVLLEPAYRLVAYRVVQEGLTNALRHAPGSRVSVVVRRGDAGVEVAVANSATEAPGAGPGTSRGLAGLRERVAACSGEVAWGPRADGGFELRALLPAVRPVVTS